MSRQQRTANNRGQQPVKTLAFVRPIAWQIQQVQATQIRVEFLDATGEMFVTGIPQFQLSQDGSFPNAAEIIAGILWLTFIPNIQPNATITLAPKDPAVRSSQGAFLAPGTAQFSVLPPPSVSFQDTGTVATDVAVAANDVGGVWGFPSTSTPEYVTIIVPVTFLLPITIGAFTVNPGEAISYVWNGSAWVLA